MTNTVLKNILRYLSLVLFQVLILQRVVLGEDWLNFPAVFIYPLFILLLPLRTPHAFLVLLGFLTGLTVDIFYGTPGLHAAASTFCAYIRPSVLRMLEPRGGYNVNHSPTKYQYGFGWFMQYSSILLFLHLFFYFSADAFTFAYLKEISLRTLASFVFSMLFLILYIYSLNPKE